MQEGLHDLLRVIHRKLGDHYQWHKTQERLVNVLMLSCSRSVNVLSDPSPSSVRRMSLDYKKPFAKRSTIARNDILCVAARKERK